MDFKDLSARIILQKALPSAMKPAIFIGMNHLGITRSWPVISLGLLLLLSVGGCSMVFPIIAPFEDIPAPTGSYGVGTRTDCLVDSSREEFFTPEADFRRLVTQVWYPISRQIVSSRAPYIEYPQYRVPALAKQLRLPKSFIQHIQKVRSNSTPGADALNNGSSFPLILFSHGLGGMRFQNTALLEDLASYGYIVVAVDHSYDANVVVFSPHDLAE
jgi:hypothetical protein